MQVHPTTNRCPATFGRGFTLIEILVVMVIMAILISLSVALLGTSGTQARIAATQTTLKHIDALISQRTEAFRTSNVNKIVDLFIRAYISANPSATFTPQDRKAIEILVRKNLYRQLFPTLPRDMWGMDGDEMTTWDNSPLATQIDGMWTGPELLYWSMNQGTAYGLSPLNIDGIPATAIAESSSGRKIFVDGWGQPIEMIRWPTGLMTSANQPYAKILIPGLPSAVNKDPDDPLRVLEKNTKFSAFAMPPVSTFDLDDDGMAPPVVTANAFGDADYHEAQAYHTPLLISGGPDKTIGVTGPHGDTVDSATVTDDITNRQGR
jgi:prepilin-type N-terminal cleavage/methylation domain-containing protein